MLVANSFDLWQKDAFFSAAEEVQQSADIMESAYRTWLSAGREGVTHQKLDELSRQLQMALGTAKWQLEEFERAVRMSYISHGDDVTINRHRQFVSAIKEQISCVETAFKKSFDAEGKKPFRWVHLDEQECDDLALFLSGMPGTSQQSTDHGMIPLTEITSSLDANKNTKEYSEVSSNIKITNHAKSAEDVSMRNNDANGFREHEKGRFLEMQTEINYESDRNVSNQRAWSSPDTFALEIVVDQDDRQKNALIGPTPKEKGYKAFFWSSRSEERSEEKGISNYTQLKIIRMINQCLRSHRNNSQQVYSVLPVSSIRYILAMMLTVFLVVPFLVYTS